MSDPFPFGAAATSSSMDELVRHLQQLRRELTDLAFELELKGQLAGADVAITTAARIAEVCDLAKQRE
jgi:hypothetical protein